MGVMQISSSRGTEEPNGITRNSNERVDKVNRCKFFANDRNFGLHA